MHRFFLLFFLLCSFQLAWGQATKLHSQSFYEQLKADKNAQLLDLRAPAHFQRGHIRRAINLDYNAENFEEKLLATFDTGRPLYIYCYSGVRSQEAQAYLTELGFKKVFWLDGGFGQWTSDSKPYVSNSIDTAPIAAFTEKDFTMAINQKGIVFVDFYAVWCGPCKKMAPVLAAVQQQMPQVRMLKIDAELNEHLAKRFDILEIPTYLVFKDGKQVWRGSGIKSQAELKSVMQ